MDAEHKQELKQNDLEEFLRNFRAWWNDHGTSTLLVVLIVLASFLLVRWLSGRAAAAQEAAYTELFLATTPLAKQELAERYAHVPGLAGKARLEAAQLLLQDALFGRAAAGPVGPGTQAPPLTEAEKKSRLERARSLFAKVIEINGPGAAESSALQRLNARFGLAAAAESLGDFDTATQQYVRIQEEAKADWPNLQEEAKTRASEIERLQVPVVFPPPKKPEPKDGDAKDGTAEPGKKAGDGSSEGGPGEKKKPAPSKPGPDADPPAPDPGNKSAPPAGAK
ncbi:MAG: hypothetical protein OER86_08400 [Phycisphaerae bacterium]|nr:hypothetical protein [Phycisphaerae bacterium]